MTLPIAIDPADVEQLVLALARHGACAETGVCRPVYSEAWAGAQSMVATWWSEAGLTTWRDAAGSAWGRLESVQPGPSIVTGSHIDSQVPGGRYDGALGVIAGTLAVRALMERFGPPQRPIDIVSLAQEESSRFPQAYFWSSRAILGLASLEELDELRAYSGETMRQAMGAAGLNPEHLLHARREDIAAFLELHIEQGPVLEAAGTPVGIVEAITGSCTYYIEINGRADHAGTVPMALRCDPMPAVATIIQGALTAARSMGHPAVSNVGRLMVEPNSPSIVPARVSLTINARHPSPDGYETLQARNRALLAEVAAAHPELTIEWSTRGGPPIPCAPELVQLLQNAAAEQGIRTLTMPSGGGHDSQMMAPRFPTAMIFVQSRDGRSHTPEEYTDPEHAAAGIELLATTLHRLAY